MTLRQAEPAFLRFLQLRHDGGTIARVPTVPPSHLRERIEHLMQQRCERVQLPTPGRLRSAWIALRSLVVFHAIRLGAAGVR